MFSEPIFSASTFCNTMFIRTILTVALVVVALLAPTAEAGQPADVCYVKRQKCCYKWKLCGPPKTRTVRKVYKCPQQKCRTHGSVRKCLTVPHTCYKIEYYATPKYCAKLHCDQHEVVQGTEGQPPDFEDKEAGGTFVKAVTGKVEEASDSGDTTE